MEPTPRQLEVFEAVCRLGSQKAAAAELGITVRTVDACVSRMYQRIGALGVGHAAWMLWGPSTRPQTESVCEITRPAVLHGAHL